MSETEIAVPQAAEAERAVLGVCMQSGAALAEIAAILNVSDFYHPAHASIYAALLDLAAAGVKPDPMVTFHELKRIGALERVGGGPYLHTLVAGPATGVNVTHFARIVRQANRARQVLQVHQRLGQALLERVEDPDELMMAVAQQSLALELLADEQAYDAPVEGLSQWYPFWDTPDNPQDWIIDGVLERQDTMIVLGGEGVGKSTYVRQVALAIAGGVNPFDPASFQIPQATTLVDLENAESMLRRESRSMGFAVGIASGGGDAGLSHVWSKCDGLNIRDRADALLLERVVADTKPAVLVIGPLYKAFRRGGDDWETAAAEAREVFDRIRRRHRCAIVLEHHMPKGSGGRDRPQVPYGSSEWSRWCSVGRIINRVGENMYELDNFRAGDRGHRRLPPALARGGTLPWTSVWDEAEIEFGRWPENKREAHR
jgi:hypothetical protein